MKFFWVDIKIKNMVVNKTIRSQQKITKCPHKSGDNNYYGYQKLYNVMDIYNINIINECLQSQVHQKGGKEHYLPRK